MMRQTADQTGTTYDDEDLVASPEVRRMLGGISVMTIWRWRHSEIVQFPEPDFIISGRDYWKRETIRRFCERHANQAAGRRITARTLELANI